MSDFQYRKAGFQHLYSNHHELIPDDKTHETALLVYYTLIDMNMDNVVDDNTFDFLTPLTKESEIIICISCPKPLNRRHQMIYHSTHDCYVVEPIGLHPISLHFVTIS